VRHHAGSSDEHPFERRNGGIEDRVVVRPMEAIDGTSVVDIKPVLRRRG
jgi:tRNA (Thr-GGU) A37 N-methylase